MIRINSAMVLEIVIPTTQLPVWLIFAIMFYRELKASGKIQPIQLCDWFSSILGCICCCENWEQTVPIVPTVPTNQPLPACATLPIISTQPPPYIQAVDLANTIYVHRKVFELPSPPYEEEHAPIRKTSSPLRLNSSSTC